MQRDDSLEKTLMQGQIEGKRRGRQRMRWHHSLNGHEFEQTPGDSEGQGSLACCSPWGHKESDTTELQQGTLWSGNLIGQRGANGEIVSKQRLCSRGTIICTFWVTWEEAYGNYSGLLSPKPA